MESVAETIMAMVFLLLVGLFVVLIGPILYVLFAALGGLIVQVTFGQWVVEGLALLGLHVPVDSVWKLAVALAFVGGYFRSNLTTQNKDKK